MKKIFINGRFFTQKITGEQRYALEMISALDELLSRSSSNAELEWCILLPKKMKAYLPIKKYENIKIKKVGFLKGHLWEQLELPFYTKNNLLINFCDMAPILKKNQVVTIHDMAIMRYPEFYTKLFRYWHLFVYKCLARRNITFCTVSEFSKKEINKYLHVEFDKINIIYPACAAHLNNSKIYDTDFIKKHNIDLNKNILLAVSSLSKNKNFKSIIEAIKYVNVDNLELVIAGGANSKEFANKNTHEYLKDAKYVGYISDEELITLYKIANCFVYPSFYEGFGLPPIEAMTYGCPVIVSKQTALPEVCGENAIYCDPLSIKDIARKIEQVLLDKNLQKEFYLKGKEHAKKYSYKISADKYFKLIMELC